MHSMLDNILVGKRCYFISPHLDDAVFSAGALLYELAKKTRVVVINVFTEGGNRPYTYSIKRYLQLCGYTDVKRLFEDRKKEDSEVMSVLGVDYHNLALPEAPYRKLDASDLSLLRKIPGSLIPEFKHSYPTYRWHVVKGRMAESDKSVVATIENAISGIIERPDESYLFCPLGVGDHVDHIILRDLCTNEFNNIVYWQDTPYDDANGKAQDYIRDKGLSRVVFTEHLVEKRRLMKMYKTQYPAVFAQGLTVTPPDVFYLRERK